jgi:hypothetical protein
MRNAFENYEATVLFLSIVCGIWVAQRVVRHVMSCTNVYESPYAWQSPFDTSLVLLEIALVLLLLLLYCAFRLDWANTVWLPLIYTLRNGQVWQPDFEFVFEEQQQQQV